MAARALGMPGKCYFIEKHGQLLWDSVYGLVKRGITPSNSSLKAASSGILQFSIADSLRLDKGPIVPTIISNDYKEEACPPHSYHAPAHRTSKIAMVRERRRWSSHAHRA